MADFSWVVAGPYCTLLLAWMGAEVIRINSSRARGAVAPERAADLDRYLNHNKMSITLDLTTPEGVNLAKELVKVCDLVIENFRPGTMQRFGLGYQDLVKVKPDLVMVSSSYVGEEGPQSRYTGFAPMFATMAGLSYITGYPDGIPAEFRTMVDYTVGHTTAYAALVALYHQRAKGKGQHVDLASRDAITSLIGEHLLDAQLNGPDSKFGAEPRTGNRDQIMAPHGVYRCKGEDSWITIAVANQMEWHGLCRAIGHPEWQTDERLCDVYGRWTHQDELDKVLEAWTMKYTPFELMEHLQGLGVAAVSSYGVNALFGDPHLNERRFSQEMTESSGERYTVLTAPWMLDGHRPGAKRQAPYPGEDNQEVLGNLLGVPANELERLVVQGVIS